jgi:hypothetical protein
MVSGADLVVWIGALGGQGSTWGLWRRVRRRVKRVGGLRATGKKGYRTTKSTLDAGRGFDGGWECGESAGRTDALASVRAIWISAATQAFYRLAADEVRRVPRKLAGTCAGARANRFGGGGDRMREPATVRADGERPMEWTAYAWDVGSVIVIDYRLQSCGSEGRSSHGRTRAFSGKRQARSCASRAFQWTRQGLP